MRIRTTPIEQATPATPAQSQLQHFLAAKARKEKAEAELEAQKQALITLMQQEGHKTIAMEHEGTLVKATLAKTTRTSWNEDGLKKALGASDFAKVTTPKVDTKKMESAINLGLVDPNKAAMHCTQTTSHYIRTSEKKVEDDPVAGQ